MSTRDSIINYAQSIAFNLNSAVEWIGAGYENDPDSTIDDDPEFEMYRPQLEQIGLNIRQFSTDVDAVFSTYYHHKELHNAPLRIEHISAGSFSILATLSFLYSLAPIIDLFAEEFVDDSDVLNAKFLWGEYPITYDSRAFHSARQLVLLGDLEPAVLNLTLSSSVANDVRSRAAEVWLPGHCTYIANGLIMESQRLFLSQEQENKPTAGKEPYLGLVESVSGFELDGERIQFGTAYNVKLLVSLLIHAGKDGMAKSELYDAIYPDGDRLPSNLDQFKGRANDKLMPFGIQVSTNNRGIWFVEKFNS